MSTLCRWVVEVQRDELAPTIIIIRDAKDAFDLITSSSEMLAMLSF